MGELAYYVAYDDGDILIRNNPHAKKVEDVVIQRYDESAQQWVTDFEMSQIHFGGIPTKRITEEEANKIIQQKAQ